MAMVDFEEHFNGQTVQVVYHGGCPDGCLSACILRNAILEKYRPLRLDLFPTSHSGRNADQLEEGSTAIFADVSPTLEDEPQLKKCRCVIILDHHPSATAAQEQLQKSLPQLFNFSDASGPECGATLVKKFCASPSVPDDVVHLFHRLDVFQHELPADMLKHYDGFKGFITQRGIGKCTVELVEEVLADVDAALCKGRELYKETAEHTKKLFERRALLADSTMVSVYAAEIDGDAAKAIDMELWQKLIDELSRPDKEVAFATLNRAPQSSGLWQVGLRRAGGGLDMGKVAQQLGQCSSLDFRSGGGHPYAAGAQCGDFKLPAERICEEVSRICQVILKESPKAGTRPRRREPDSHDSGARHVIEAGRSNSVRARGVFHLYMELSPDKFKD